MNSFRKARFLVLFALTSFSVLLFVSVSSAAVSVVLFLDFDDPLSSQFRTMLEEEITALGGITLAGKEQMLVEDCAIVSVTGFRYRSESGEDLGFAFSYAFGYSETDNYYCLEYHNVLVGYPRHEGLRWAAEEIAVEFDIELDLFW